MPEVSLAIGDRTHSVACRAGEEAQLEQLGAVLDGYWANARRASGGLNGERTMLFIALMLADALGEAERRPSAASNDAELAHVADRLEALASALEEPASSA